MDEVTNCVDKEMFRITGVAQPLLSDGLIRLHEVSSGGGESVTICHAIFKDAINHNIIHEWTDDNGNTTAGGLLHDVICNISPHSLANLVDTLTTKQGVCINVDVWESLENDDCEECGDCGDCNETLDELGIMIEQSDLEILSRLIVRWYPYWG